MPIVSLGLHVTDTVPHDGRRQAERHPWTPRSACSSFCIDIALAVLLVGTYMTGHMEPHAHALVALLFVVLLVVHGVVSHRKIVQTTRHVTCKAMNKEARIDCCLGLAMVVFLAIVLVSGGSLMHARMAEGLSFDDTVGTPAFFAHVCGAVLFLLCALAHVWINRERLEKLLHRTDEKD